MFIKERLKGQAPSMIYRLQGARQFCSHLRFTVKGCFNHVDSGHLTLIGLNHITICVEMHENLHSLK